MEKCTKEDCDFFDDDEPTNCKYVYDVLKCVNYSIHIHNQGIIRNLNKALDNAVEEIYACRGTKSSRDKIRAGLLKEGV